MHTAARTASGCLHRAAQALNAPIDAPAATTSIEGVRQSSRMTGSTSA